MKRDKILKGGLNALLGGNQTQEAAPTAPDPEATTPTDEAGTPEVTPYPTPEEATPEEEDALLASIEDEELRAALHRKRMQHRGRPKKDAALRQKEEEIYTRSSWIMRRDLLAKLKEISFRETLTIKEIMEQIVGDAVAAYEQKHGEVIPRDHKGDASQLFK